MSFQKYDFVSIVYDNPTNTVKVQLLVEDDVLGVYTANVTMGEEHFLTLPDNLPVASNAREAIIRAECRSQIARHYEILAENIIKAAIVPDETIIAPYSAETSLVDP